MSLDCTTKHSKDIGNTLSKDMGNTSLTGGPTHALERCYRERTATEVPGRLPAQLLPRYRASRTLQHLAEARLQVDRLIRGRRSERLSRALSPTAWLPLADGPGDRPGA